MPSFSANTKFQQGDSVGGLSVVSRLYPKYLTIYLLTFKLDQIRFLNPNQFEVINGASIARERIFFSQSQISQYSFSAYISVLCKCLPLGDKWVAEK